jgi:hypothetical protein
VDATGSLLFRCCCCSGVVDDIVDQRARVRDREREIINKQKRESARAFFMQLELTKYKRKYEREPLLNTSDATTPCEKRTTL